MIFGTRMQPLVDNCIPTVMILRITAVPLLWYCFNTLYCFKNHSSSSGRSTPQLWQQRGRRYRWIKNTDSQSKSIQIYGKWRSTCRSLIQHGTRHSGMCSVPFHEPISFLFSVLCTTCSNNRSSICINHWYPFPCQLQHQQYRSSAWILS